jgi:hypothetical protein
VSSSSQQYYLGMGNVFIIGAGASCFAGYPLGLDLWKFIRDNSTQEVMAKERAKAVSSGLERVFEVLPPRELDRPELEEIFTLLDLAAAGIEPLELV